MWALCTLLVIVEARAHAHSGRSLRVWWLLNSVAACYHVYFDLAEWGQDGWGAPRTELALQLAGFLPSLLLGLAASFEPDSPNERAYARDHEAPAEEKGLKSNAEATASFFSRITFSWVTSILVTGKARALEHTDLFMLQTADATKLNFDLLLRAWEVEAAGPRKSYLRAWHVAFGAYFWRTGVLKLINDSCMLLNPIIINTIVDFIDGRNSLSPSAAILCALAMFAANSVKSFA